MSEEEERQYRREQLELLNVIVSKLILIESGQTASEKSVFYGVTRATNKMIQKMRSEIIREIRNGRGPKYTLWQRIKYKYFHYHNRLKRMFKR